MTDDVLIIPSVVSLVKHKAIAIYEQGGNLISLSKGERHHKVRSRPLRGMVGTCDQTAASKAWVRRGGRRGAGTGRLCTAETDLFSQVAQQERGDGSHIAHVEQEDGDREESTHGNAQREG